MAHVVQLILRPFMSLIKVKSQDAHMASGLNAGNIEKVMTLNNAIHKTVE